MARLRVMAALLQTVPVIVYVGNNLTNIYSQTKSITMNETT